MNMNTQQLLNVLKNDDASLDTLLEKIPDLTFVDYLQYLISQSPLSKGDIIKNSTLDRTYCYQIIEGRRLPSKDKVIALAIGMHLDLDDTDRLLKLANQGTLYSKVKRDALIIYAISHHYDMMKTNELLYEYDFELIK
ncbi:MAG: hypothetical protein J6P61_09985 [Erysipelotrichaceae bacterium]|nr:hypothetical protein [Erysipelotrichaceae bacterium]